MLASISAVKDTDESSCYHKDKLATFLNQLMKEHEVVQNCNIAIHQSHSQTSSDTISHCHSFNDSTYDASLHCHEQATLIMNVPYLCETHWCWRL